MTHLIYCLFFTFYLFIIQTNALVCHQCSHRNSREASRLRIHDRVQSSPEHCEEKKYCEGNWCIQTLIGGNVSFGCVDQTPLQYIWEAKEISSHCTASFDVDGISHATCWCRSHDLCNSSIVLNPTICLTLLSLLILSVLI